MSTTAVARYRAAPIWALGMGLALMFVGVAPAQAAEQLGPTGNDTVLRLSGTPVAMTVTPDAPAYWEIGITTAPITTQTLMSAVTATGPSGTPTHALTIALSSCTAAWQQASCSGTEHQILQPTRMTELTGAAFPVTATATIPARLHLLARVTQPTPAAKSQTAAVTIRVSATGDNTPDQISSARTPTGALAYTGARLTFCALAAALSVTSGMLLARLRKRTRQL